MNKSTKFAGFTPATIQFLKDLGENNNKLWFDDHRAIYESELLQPLKNLVIAMTPAMYEVDKQIDFRPNRAISRIYRDVRFSPDKSPYKNRMWITFQRMVSEWENFPGFFMEISPEGYQYGMGLYMAKKKVMDEFRSKIEFEQAHFKEITESILSKHGFHVEGELYKRSLKNDLPDYYQDWVQRKSVWLFKTCPVGNEMFSEEFAHVLASDFSQMKPLYDFMVDACE